MASGGLSEVARGESESLPPELGGLLGGLVASARGWGEGGGAWRSWRRSQLGVPSSKSKQSARSAIRSKGSDTLASMGSSVDANCLSDGPSASCLVKRRIFPRGLCWEIWVHCHPGTSRAHSCRGVLAWRWHAGGVKASQRRACANLGENPLVPNLALAVRLCAEVGGGGNEHGKASVGGERRTSSFAALVALLSFGTDAHASRGLFPQVA